MDTVVHSLAAIARFSPRPTIPGQYAHWVASPGRKLTVKTLPRNVKRVTKKSALKMQALAACRQYSNPKISRISPRTTAGVIYANVTRMYGESIRLQPGMAVTAEVQTGERRIIEFFLAPLLRHRKESLRER